MTFPWQDSARSSGDITYIRTHGGFMYLAVVIDWHS